MLAKIIGFFKHLGSKNAARIGFALSAIVALTVGTVSVDGSLTAYGDTVISADVAFGGADEEFGDADIEKTETDGVLTDGSDATEDTGNAESTEGTDGTEEKTEPAKLDRIGEGSYELNPIGLTTTRVTVTETVKYSYKKVYSDKLYRGETETSAGKNGEKEVIYTIVMLNGVEVYRDSFSEEITKEPVPQIETIGTKLHASAAVMTSEDVKSISTLKPDSPIELDKNGVPVSYKKVITGKSSAYCGKCDNNMTAIGLPAQPGLVAVNFAQIPKYTKMYIVANDGTVYGYAIAADTGGFASNGSKRIVDVRMPTGSKCTCGSNWGVKNVKIYILE